MTKLSRAEQAVSMEGSRDPAVPPPPREASQPWRRKSTRRAGTPWESRSCRGASSADRWHRAGSRYLRRGGGGIHSKTSRRLRQLIGVHCYISKDTQDSLSVQTDFLRPQYATLYLRAPSAVHALPWGPSATDISDIQLAKPSACPPASR